MSNAPSRRAVIGAAAATGIGLAAPRIARAQGFPRRPITLIITFAPGGATDRHMRVFADLASNALGQRVVIENRPGAGGTLGAAHVATQRPDGYTLTLIPVTVFRYQHMQQTAYDALRDFTYLIHLTGYTFGVAVRADSPVKSWADLLAVARARPEQVSYATPGVGTSLHVTMEELAQRETVKFNHIPYRGDAEQAQALLGGHVDCIAASTGIAPMVDEGRLRLLNVWTPERRPRWPTVPTLIDLGYGMSSTSPYGIAGPKDMDPEVVKVLHDGFRTALNAPEHVDVLGKQEQPVLYMGPAEYTAFVQKEFAREAELVKRLNLKV